MILLNNNVIMKKPIKKLGFYTLTALVVGNMIGSGIFLLPANLAAIGSISLYSWLFTATGAVILALMFANLSLQMPRIGGPYAYVKARLGNFLGFQTAYNYWIAVWVGNAAIALVTISYASIFVPILDDSHIASYAAIILVWLLTLTNLLGVYISGWIELFTILCKLVVIIFIGIAGWHFVSVQNYTMAVNITTPHRSNVVAITMGAALTLWYFIGLESATVPAESVNDPKRNIPRATVIGTLIAAVVCIVSSSVIIGMLPTATLQHDHAPFASAAQIIFRPTGKTIVAIGAIISCFGCLNGWILPQGQIAMAAAEDHLFPKIFAKRNHRQVPAIGLIIASLLITLLLLLTLSNSLIKQFQVIIMLAVLASLIPYFYTAIAQIILLRQEKHRQQKKLGPWCITLIAMLYSAWAILGTGEKILFYGCILLLSSVPAYLFCQHQHGEK